MEEHGVSALFKPDIVVLPAQQLCRCSAFSVTPDGASARRLQIVNIQGYPRSCVATACIRGIRIFLRNGKLRCVRFPVRADLSCQRLHSAANIALNVHMFVDNRLYHYGPTAYLLEHYDNEFNVLYNASYVAANILVEALLIRVHVRSIFSMELIPASSIVALLSHKKWIVDIPAVIYMASTGQSHNSRAQNYKLHSGSHVMSLPIPDYQNIAQSVDSIALCSCVLPCHILRSVAALPHTNASELASVTPSLTLLIAGRLMAMKRFKETLGPEHARTYTSIAASSSRAPRHMLSHTLPSSSPIASATPVPT